MDWTCPILLDEIWGRLLTLHWLRMYRKYLYKTPLHMWFAIANVCSEIRRRHPVQSLYRIVERPYIENLESLHLQSLMIHNEFALRQFFEDVQRACLIFKVEIVCAGGYPAWRLDRHFQTKQGKKDFPRTIRSTTLEPCGHMLELWFPQDVDFYTTEKNSEMVILIFQDAYIRFIKTLWGTSAEMCAFLSGEADNIDWYTDVVDRENSHRSLMNHIQNEEDNLSNQLKSQLQNHALASFSYPWRNTKMQKMWTLTCPGAMGIEPSVVTIWNVEGKRNDESLSKMLSESMFLSHCSVQLCLENKEWKYVGTRQSLQDAYDRRLRIVNTNSYMRLYRMIGHYLCRGFHLSITENNESLMDVWYFQRGIHAIETVIDFAHGMLVKEL